MIGAHEGGARERLLQPLPAGVNTGGHPAGGDGPLTSGPRDQVLLWAGPFSACFRKSDSTPQR